MYKKFFKPIFDRSLAFILIILFLPVMAVVAILIFLWDGRAVIFRQKRPGKDEKIFEIYKFRTMTNEHDENGNLLPDEKRLKGIGKFIRSTSLDELHNFLMCLRAI